MVNVNENLHYLNLLEESVWSRPCYCLEAWVLVFLHEQSPMHCLYLSLCEYGVSMSAHDQIKSKLDCAQRAQTSVNRK